MTTYNNHPSCRLVCNNHLSSRFNAVQSPTGAKAGMTEGKTEGPMTVYF